MTLAVAIVGAGRMGKAHAGNLAGIPEARIVGVADVVRDAAEALAAGSGAAAFDDYREMLARLKPDLVYFCTPASDHAEQIAYAAEQGVNIFVEKPLATTVNEAKAAVDAVERHGVLCTVGYQWRYSPTTNAAREALGDLPITLLGGWWYWTIPLIEWIKDKRLGGGQIFDQSTHVLDLMRFLAGDVTSIYAAYTRNAIPEADLPNWDAYALTLRFAQGAVGSLHSTYALFPKIPNSNALDVVARELLVRVNLARTVVFRRDQAPVETPAVAGWNIDQTIVPIIARNDAAAIRATARQSMLSLAVTLAANSSAETGKIVDLTEFVANPPTDVTIMPDARPAFVR
ncbi:MAG: Gfo/Idh/MocA family protein [Thermomicrobiales bacterium]